MANLNTNNRVLTVYNEEHNVAIRLDTKTVTKLSAGPAEAAAESRKLSCGGGGGGDAYMGLTRHCSALSPNGQLYAVAARRELLVWATDDWSHKCSRTLSRAASKITFTPSSDKILVADKTGDVYLYALAEGGGGGGCLLLGHLSILLDVVMTPDERYIVTCDRDEKIRVTHYPNTYNIERFCLGHAAFVTKLLLLQDQPEVLLSASGDGTLKFWQFVCGKCVATYSVEKDVVRDAVAGSGSIRPIVTNVAIVHEGEQLVICVSVFKYNGLLVYVCGGGEPRYQLALVQRIDCCEPLDFVACESLLWILNYSPTCLLKVFSWHSNKQQFVNVVSLPHLQEVCTLVNEHCSSLAGSSVDLSVLYKTFDLKEKSQVKKVKLQ